MPAEDTNPEISQRKLPVKIIKAVRDFLAGQPDVVAVHLFGSFGTEFEGRHSDIDLGIVYIPGKQPGLRRELSLGSELSLLLKRDGIDLINLNRTPLHFLPDDNFIFSADSAFGKMAGHSPLPAIHIYDTSGADIVTFA